MSQSQVTELKLQLSSKLRESGVFTQIREALASSSAAQQTDDYVLTALEEKELLGRLINSTKGQSKSSIMSPDTGNKLEPHTRFVETCI